MAANVTILNTRPNGESVPSTEKIVSLFEDHTDIILDENLAQEANLGAAPNDIWNSTNYGALPLGTNPAPSYKITVGTAKGNFYERVVQPWNLS